MARLTPPLVRRLLVPAMGAAVVAATVAAVGAGPFLRGIASLTPVPILGAVLLAAAATAAAAWRWSVVAGALGIPLTWPAAVAAYYRSQFLNTVLPGGVLGDVHRAYRHGRGAAQPVAAARAVATERIAGQLAQLVLVVAVLTVLGASAVLPGTLALAAVIVLAAAAALGIVAATPRGRRLARRELADLRRVAAPRTRARGRRVVGDRRRVPRGGLRHRVSRHRGRGVAAELIVLALVALSAGSVPVNLGGWGPREAASASAFALVGLGSGAGLAASAAFGVLTMIALAPGAIVLVADRIAASRAPTRRPVPVPQEIPA
ncbi:hypothetical protein GCM10025881_23720 [Pseudolysinimonas kribbensis]|uniref:Flippase-like domain-containing protein n=1 Tax=Pseudolysinimonas kribbensis TaxID=433641 RepID=A0ABQ6K4J9_9MICO|nr:lysylphosphatidylglycerol synthase domain-containing protein [Pseudolysinimonas kribbensis]GMA95548.1 hypothetical protein GCM10025881_23720 [Pseudolysinimonas kribbensis]